MASNVIRLLGKAETVERILRRRERCRSENDLHGMHECDAKLAHFDPLEVEARKTRADEDVARSVTDSVDLSLDRQQM